MEEKIESGEYTKEYVGNEKKRKFLENQPWKRKRICKETQEDNVIYQGFENYQKEYSYIGEKIKKLVREDRCGYSDIACIFRTNSDMTGLAEYFARNKIPFVMKEKCNSIFNHFIALDLLAYLQFFLEGKKRSDFIRIMNKPLRYLSRNALSSLKGEEITWFELKKIL